METTTGMAQIIADIGTFLTAAVGWMGEVADFIMGEPFVLLMAIVIPLSGWAIGGLKRLISLN